ncbi:MAG: hypothetical protein MR766_04155 [Erysipelotrichaceae bacterium]|nr:hypothetical protein [Erysipelotrichaceae bacterium]
MPNNFKAIDFEYLLIEHYKNLNISENELAVILVLNHLLKQKNDIITAEALSFKMNLEPREIDETLSILVKKNIVDLEIKGTSAKLSLLPLRKKLFNQFKIDILKEEEAQKEEMLSKMQNVYGILEKELKRTLSPIEISRIQEWFTINYTEKDIENAVKDLIATGKKVTINAVDKKLLAKAKAEELNKEGVTALSDKWSKNMEETIKIAKMKWLDD